ncbi:MAG: hypothetical protein Q4A61_00730, partial [Porphyromonadaceae bacterium]|nr:hypothetical protein [Porphyromonadaceae bacterium]
KKKKHQNELTNFLENLAKNPFSLSLCAPKVKLIRGYRSPFNLEQGHNEGSEIAPISSRIYGPKKEFYI